MPPSIATVDSPVSPLPLDDARDDASVPDKTVQSRWVCPLPLSLEPTEDSESFRGYSQGVTGLPLGQHPGAFGVVRKHHIHEGVDLYCAAGTEVRAVEDGVVVAVLPFTGVEAGLPWWLDTEAVLVEGASGVVLYGEVGAKVRSGDALLAGQLLGHVVRVLRNDKGRPTSMLHLELHVPGTRNLVEWYEHAPRPTSLLDPTPMLQGSIGNVKERSRI